MPELPEVETVRRTLLPRVVGRRVRKVEVRGPHMVSGPASPEALMEGCRIDGIERRGKELLFHGSRGEGVSGARRSGRSKGAGTVSFRGLHETEPVPSACFTLHLGMTGSLRYFPPELAHLAGSLADDPQKPDRHVHLLWHLDDGGVMRFRDPRMFGGIWTFPCAADARQVRYEARMAEDALTITPEVLYEHLHQTRRAIKAALLDQAVVAGLGNIYVDELLFALGIHPERPANTVRKDEVKRMVPRMRRLLERSIRHGATTLFDGTYMNAEGETGRFLRMLRAYGRAGEPCYRCGETMKGIRVGGRSTSFCPHCQPRR